MTTKKVDTDGVQFFDILPGEHLDYTAQWANAFDPLVDTISSAEISSINTGLATSSAVHTTSTHTIWVTPSAGNANTNYNFASKVFTAGGRVDKLRFRIKVGS